MSDIYTQPVMTDKQTGEAAGDGKAQKKHSRFPPSLNLCQGMAKLDNDIEQKPGYSWDRTQALK